mgnify:CR=1 FL=1
MYRNSEFYKAKWQSLKYPDLLLLVFVFLSTYTQLNQAKETLYTDFNYKFHKLDNSDIFSYQYVNTNKKI